VTSSEKKKNPRSSEGEEEQELVERYPQHCSGAAYFMSPDMVRHFLMAAAKVKESFAGIPVLNLVDRV